MHQATVGSTTQTAVHTLADYATQSASHSTTTESRHTSFQPFTMGAQGFSTGMEYASGEAMHNGMRIIGEQTIEHEVKVPKKIMVEEVIQKTIVVPETIVTEKTIEETHKMRERIVKVAKEVYIDKIVEEPVVEVVEKIIEREEVQIVYHERPVDKVEVREVVVERKVPVETVKHVEYDAPQYVEVEKLKVVEVPESKIVYKDVPRPVDQYVTVDVPVVKEVEVFQEVPRIVPVGVEHITHQTYNLPQLQAEVEEVPYPVFVPKFTEVPVPADQMTEESKLQAEGFARQVMMATAQQMPSLCVLEDLGNQAKKMIPQMETNPQVLQKRHEEKIRKVMMEQASPPTTA